VAFSWLQEKLPHRRNPHAAFDASSALLALIGDASGGAFGPDGADEASCVSICELRAAELHCSMLNGAVNRAASCGTRLLREQVRAFLACFTKAERMHWECNDDGMPVLGMVRVGAGEHADCLMLTNGKL